MIRQILGEEERREDLLGGRAKKFTVSTVIEIDVVAASRRLQLRGGTVRRVTVPRPESKRKRERPHKRWRDAVIAD